MTRPLGVDEALHVVDGRLARPDAVVVHPTDRHAPILRELPAPLGGGATLTSDAHLATLSIGHGAELRSSDADSARFPAVRWRDRLRDASSPRARRRGP